MALRAPRRRRDVHMPSSVGPRSSRSAGAKIHTARSRNDQSRRRCDSSHVTPSPRSRARSSSSWMPWARSCAYPSAYLPGYTICSGATGPVDPSPGGARVVATARRGRLIDARERMNVSPLGAGALRNVARDCPSFHGAGPRFSRDLREFDGRGE